MNRNNRTYLSSSKLESIISKSKINFPASKEEVVAIMQYCYRLGYSSDLLHVEYKTAVQPTQPTQPT